MEHKYHGGLCCGARHIHGFGQRSTEQALSRHLNSIGSGQLTEVILTKNQCTNLPHVLQMLDKRGFILTDSWRNRNTRSVLYRFSRADQRHPLVAPNWNGRVANKSRKGLLKDNGKSRATYQIRGKTF